MTTRVIILRENGKGVGSEEFSSVLLLCWIKPQNSQVSTFSHRTYLSIEKGFDYLGT